MATIQEVAKQAGVSVGSVSRYLNGYQLRADNMKKIEAAIKALDYKENFFAKGLKNNQTLSIGVLMNNMQSNFSAALVASLEDELEGYGYSILLSGFRNDPEKFAKKLDFLLTRSVDGLIIFEAEESWPGTQRLRDVNVPTISLNTPIDFPKVDSILVNDRQSTQAVIERMITEGHRKIGIIAAPQKDYVAKERLQGALAAFRAKGLEGEACVYYGDYSEESGYQGMQQLWEQDQVTAVFVCNYKMSLGVLRAIYEKQLRIGQDLAFASYDYFEASEIFQPKLTVIRQPVAKIGAVAAKRMMEKIQQHNQAEGETLTIPNEILWRDSIRKKGS